MLRCDPFRVGNLSGIIPGVALVLTHGLTPGYHV